MRRRVDECASITFASAAADAWCVGAHVRRLDGILHGGALQVELDDVFTLRLHP